jgi:hypothetical protein
LSTTKPTCPDLGSKQDRRCGKPANNRLSYCTAKKSSATVFKNETSGSSLEYVVIEKYHCISIYMKNEYSREAKF